MPAIARMLRASDDPATCANSDRTEQCLVYLDRRPRQLGVDHPGPLSNVAYQSTIMVVLKSENISWNVDIFHFQTEEGVFLGQTRALTIMICSGCCRSIWQNFSPGNP